MIYLFHFRAGSLFIWVSNGVIFSQFSLSLILDLFSKWMKSKWCEKKYLSLRNFCWLLYFSLDTDKWEESERKTIPYKKFLESKEEPKSISSKIFGEFQKNLLQRSKIWQEWHGRANCCFDSSLLEFILELKFCKVWNNS